MLTTASEQSNDCDSVSAERKTADRLPVTEDYQWFSIGVGCGNDPSAGSPTETLLRLHLPLNDEV
jgi:hypothetical protein